MALPTTPIVDTPGDQKSCLLRIDKNLKGEQRASQHAEYDCQMNTVMGKLELRLIISTAKCDEDPNLKLIPNDSKLDASGYYIRRKDGVAHFWGTFTIKRPSGTTVFKGRIETFYRVGSHTAGQCEPCNPENHVEGWLVGAHTDGKQSLRAMIAAKAAPPVVNSTNNIFAGKLSGVVIRPL
jgi:hypothetical protein